MKIAFADVETNGFLEHLDRVHCLAVCFRSGEPQSFVGEDVPRGLALLDTCDTIVFHNGFGFDLPALEKVYGWRPKAAVEDTLLLSRLFWPDIASVGVKERHSLKSHGIRLRCYKGNYEDAMLAQGLDPWAAVNPEMIDYNLKDTKVLRQLWFACEKEMAAHDWSLSKRLKYGLAKVIHKQERRGVYVDRPLAEATIGAPESPVAPSWRWKVADIDRQLENAVAPLLTRFAAAKNFRKDGTASLAALKWLAKSPTYTIAGAEPLVCGPFERCTFLRPEWSSRQQMIALLKTYGWVPTEFTDKGNPQLTEESLLGIEGGVGKLLADRFRLEKRIGFIQGVLDHVRPDGRVTAGCNVQGTVTGRVSHRVVTSVPRITSPYGPECRAIFAAPPGRILMSADADALEARCMAHYMRDDAFTERVVNGDKDQETDIHSYNAKLWGMVPKQQYTFFGVADSGRGHSKHGLYAMLYGCFDEKLGRVLGGDEAFGKAQRARIERGIPKYADLLKTVRGRVCKINPRTGEPDRRKLKDDAHLLGLDGRKIPARSEHAAINTLFQGAGATIMEAVLLRVEQEIARLRLDAQLVIFMHDEGVYDCAPEHAEAAGRVFVEALTWAERFFKLRCPLSGTYQIGAHWGKVH